MSKNETSVGRLESLWKIPDVYLKSLWERMDSFSKGIERTSNSDWITKKKTYKECRDLLENIVIDMRPFLTYDKAKYEDLIKELEQWDDFFNKSPKTQSKEDINKYSMEMKITIRAMKEMKSRLIMVLQNKLNVLIPTLTKYEGIEGAFREHI